MTTKGKKWKWTEEAKQRVRRPRPASKGNKNGQTHGLSQIPEYNSWKKMMYRCYKEDHSDYVNYGGRGIEVCEDWHDPVNFCRDMIERWGERPAGFSIERVDVNGHYEPENCCWVPLGMQSKNRRPWKHSEKGLDNIRKARTG